MKIISRHADNDFDAFRTAQGMENAGATVFSISHNGMQQPYGAMAPSARFIVWAKVESEVMIDAVDASITKEFGDAPDDIPQPEEKP